MGGGGGTHGKSKKGGRADVLCTRYTSWSIKVQRMLRCEVQVTCLVPPPVGASFRVFIAVVVTSLSLGRAASFAGDLDKAKTAAARLFKLFATVPRIDPTSADGEKPVGGVCMCVRVCLHVCVHVHVCGVCVCVCVCVHVCLQLPSPSCCVTGAQAKTEGSIVLEKVSFSYPTRQEAPVLQSLSLTIQPGKTVALVGPSGCGKSTVVSLIERFYDPEGDSVGAIKIDGRDIRHLNVKWLRSNIGIVNQEPVLFDTSIAENIRYGANDREVTDKEVEEAARNANIHTFITSLPQVCKWVWPSQ